MKLYKYRPFNQLTLKSIVDSSLFYASPTSFNDPLDCKPTIIPDISIYKLKFTCQKLIENRRGKDNAIKIINNIFYLASQFGDFRKDYIIKKYLSTILSEHISSEIIEIFKSHGVLSLSETWSSVLMWSHYADSHRGLCLEYEIDVDSRPNLKAVNYSAKRSINGSEIYDWQFMKIENGYQKVFDTTFYAKSLEWKYEKEWRDVSGVGGELDNGYNLSAIYFGMQCDYSIIMTIIRLLNNKNVNFYRVFPQVSEFLLERYLVSPDELAEIDQIGVRTSSYLMFRNVGPIEE